MPIWSNAICETNQIQMHYTRTGGAKAPLILLHGLAANGACWASVAQGLEARYDVIMPDARGHGESSVPCDGYRYEDHAQDVEGFIEGFGLSSAPIIMGHSMGGMTAALVAARKRSSLRALVLAEPTFLSPEYQREVYEGDTIEQQKRFLKKSFDQVLSEAKIKQPHRSLDTLERINKARHQTSTLPFEVLRPPNPDFKSLVSGIEIPILLVMGDEGVISAEMAEELRSLNPRLQVETICGAGHGLHYDLPEQFVSIVSSFLGSSGSFPWSAQRSLKTRPF